jgi:hypothetical protein
MQPPAPDDRETPPAQPPPPPAVLDYEPPRVPRKAQPLSKVALLAFATSLAALYVSAALTRVVMNDARRVPFGWTELLGPTLPWVGIGLSINALLRTADPKENVRGDAIAWVALCLSLIAAQSGCCCLGLRLMGGFS